MSSLNRENYYQYPALSSTALRDFAKSRSLYKAKYIDRRIESEETKDLMVGRAFHCYAMEKDSFPSKFAFDPTHFVSTDGKGNVVREPLNRGYKNPRWREHREFYDAVTKANAGKTLIDSKWAKAFPVMADNFHRHPSVKKFMARPGTQVEFPILWKHGDLICKSLLDMVNPDVDEIVDTKTCRFIDRRDFAWEVKSKRYHWQMAFYAMAYEHMFGRPVKKISFAVCHKYETYECEVYKLGEKSLKIGFQEVESEIEKFKVCQAANVWVSETYGMEVEIDVPAGYRGGEDDGEDDGLPF